MNKTRVLLVDDHAVMRDGIRAMLALENDIEIVGEASDGNRAIEQVRKLEPDVVIMDIAMPGMDGLEATRRITKKHQSVKILILSQYDNREYVLSSIKAGAAGYLPKKALGSELISAIHSVTKGDSFLYPSAAQALVDYFQKPVGEDLFDRLTEREREIFKLIADGHTSRQIAKELFLSLKTVLGHRAKIMEKLDLHNHTDLIKYAVRKGLVSVDS